MIERAKLINTLLISRTNSINLWLKRTKERVILKDHLMKSSLQLWMITITTICLAMNLPTSVSKNRRTQQLSTRPCLNKTSDRAKITTSNTLLIPRRVMLWNQRVVKLTTRTPWKTLTNSTIEYFPRISSRLRFARIRSKSRLMRRKEPMSVRVVSLLPNNERFLWKWLKKSLNVSVLAFWMLSKLKWVKWWSTAWVLIWTLKFKLLWDLLQCRDIFRKVLIKRISS